MKKTEIFQFSWIKLILIAVINITLSYILIHFYKQQQNVAILYLLSLLSFALTGVYLLMVYSLAPANKYLTALTIFVALTPFMALPLIAYLWYVRNGVNNPYFSRYKIVLLLCGTLIALTISLEPTEFISKKELIMARILPSEISLPLLSHLEAKRVSALTPYDAVTTSCAAAKIKKLRFEKYPEFSTTTGMNPNAIFKVLPLGMSWVRGAPAHSLAIIHFHHLLR